MAKKTKKKSFPNALKFKETINVKGKKQKVFDMKFMGINGRFGATNKGFKDFSFEEMVEFYISHNKETRNKFFTGIVPLDYVGPFDKQPLPVKPTNSTDDKEVND